MTPEEAKPVYRTEMNGGWEPTFTAEETAEIAAAFSESEKSNPDQTRKWVELFKEWSK